MKFNLTSRERLIKTIEGKEVDHTPLYSWVFGFSPPQHLRWKRDEEEVKYWYTMRLEHIHALPRKWDLEDDFKRVKTWLNLGIDDVLDVSFPWSINPEVKMKDWKEEDILCREYLTPAGSLVQKVRQTKEEIPSGWVIQPDKPKLFEDFNLPRTIKFPVTETGDIPKLKYLLKPPAEKQAEEYSKRISSIKEFSSKEGVLVQGWSVFGMDGVIWLCGIERAILSAINEPEFFQELVDTVYEFDLMRTKTMIGIGGVDMIVQRGWYSSTDFWSPNLFRKYVIPNLKKMTAFVHNAGLKYAYVMTTGIMNFIEDLEDAGVDLLYFVDPGQDRVNLKKLKEKLTGNLAVAGGINSTVTLNKGNKEEIRQVVLQAMEILGKEKFILSPVDALFPDTSWESVEAMISSWKEFHS